MYLACQSLEVSQCEEVVLVGYIGRSYDFGHEMRGRLIDVINCNFIYAKTRWVNTLTLVFSKARVSPNAFLVLARVILVMIARRYCSLKSLPTCYCYIMNND